MGKVCTWCGIVLRTISGPGLPASSHALCQGCMEELQNALSSNGLRAGEPGPPSN